MMNASNSVYVAWQEPQTREWHVVGQLRQKPDGNYSFNYTHGSLASSKFIPFSGMEDRNKSYLSTDLFPLFKNRVLSNKRPEYPQFIKHLGLEDGADPISLLGRSGGARATDRLQVFQRIQIDENGAFEHIFFVHGLGYLQPSAKERVLNLTQGQELYLFPDCQNSKDKNAVGVRAEAPPEIIGYLPRYLAQDVNELLKAPKSLTAHVESLSTDAPTNYKLMCKLKGTVNTEQINQFMNREEFKPVISDV